MLYKMIRKISLPLGREIYIFNYVYLSAFLRVITIEFFTSLFNNHDVVNSCFEILFQELCMLRIESHWVENVEQELMKQFLLEVAFVQSWELMFVHPAEHQTDVSSNECFDRFIIENELLLVGVLCRILFVEALPKRLCHDSPHRLNERVECIAFAV